MIYYVSKEAAVGNAEIANRDLWIGVSDIGEEDSFTYLSDETLVNFNCENSFEGRAGKTFKRLNGFSRPFNLHPKK